MILRCAVKRLGVGIHVHDLGNTLRSKGVVCVLIQYRQLKVLSVDMRP